MRDLPASRTACSVRPRSQAALGVSHDANSPLQLQLTVTRLEPWLMLCKAMVLCIQSDSPTAIRVDSDMQWHTATHRNTPQLLCKCLYGVGLLRVSQKTHSNTQYSLVQHTSARVHTCSYTDHQQRCTALVRPCMPHWAVHRSQLIAASWAARGPETHGL